MAIARRALSDEMWTRLAHPDEDRYLDALFALVAPMLAAAQAQPHKALDLNRKEALCDARITRSFGKALKYVTTTLGVAAPEAYVRPEQKEAVAFANCIDRAHAGAGVPRWARRSSATSGRSASRCSSWRAARRICGPSGSCASSCRSRSSSAHIIDAAMALGEAPADKGARQRRRDGQDGEGDARALTPVQLEQRGGDRPQAARRRLQAPTRRR